jgi:hypothetical protein
MNLSTENTIAMPRHQRRIDHREHCRQRDEARAGDTAGALRGQHRDHQDGQLLAEGEIDAERLRNEQRRQRSPTTDLEQPSRSSFAISCGSALFRRTGAEHDQ